MATIQEILDKINASKSNNINNNSFIDLMRQISGNPEDAIQPVNDTNSIYGHIVQMYTTLYDSGVDYAVLADDIEAIQGLYERLNTIDSLYADKTKLDSLYADKIKLDQLFADKAVIDRVYGSITNIDRVYTSIDKLDTVYASILKMDTVADNIADVNTVADNMIVLNEIYDNRVEIYAADENAAIATTKAIEASNSATIATTKASEASASALAASTASNTSTTKATESAASAVLANTSAGSANTSAASASSNATIATTKASEAFVSASNASTNAANASTSASAAAVSASTSATKATEAATSASTALGYKNAVSTMKLAVETIYDTFDDRFLGTKTTNPLVDNDGNALIDGALYFDTTTNAMKVYDVGTTTWYSMPQIYLNSLLDVELTSISTGDTLIWNGTKWANHTLTKADVGLNLADNTSDATKNVLSATKLATARTINGVAFDGTANIIVSDSTAVTLIGNQTIAGVKTFSSSPIVPTATTGTHAVNKDYVDGLVVDRIGLIDYGYVAKPYHIVAFGGEFNRADYPKLWAYLQANPSLVKTQAQWIAESTANDGICGFFSSGNGTTTFRVPNLDKAFLRSDSRTVGSYQEGSYSTGDSTGTTISACGLINQDDNSSLFRKRMNWDNLSTVTIGDSNLKAASIATSYSNSYATAMTSYGVTRPKNIAVLPLIVAK